MSDSKNIALIGEKTAKPSKSSSTKEVEKKTRRQTAGDKFSHQFTVDTARTNLNQTARQQYLNIETTDPVPSTSTASNTSNTTRTSYPRRCKRKPIYKKEAHRSKVQTPWLLLDWTEGVEIWENMIAKQDTIIHKRNPRLFENQSVYSQKQRVYVLDWMMGLCSAYKLQRRTYHLAVDVLDRYMSINPPSDPIKQYLVGVTCVHIAAKYEEHRPPRPVEVSCMCNKKITVAEIVSCEQTILSSLEWQLQVPTSSTWLNFYLQLHEYSKVDEQGMHQVVDHSLLYAQYSPFDFVRASHIIDLFAYVPEFLLYPYNVIAAAAVFFIHGEKTAIGVSGLTWKQLEDCIKDMFAFYKVLSKTNNPLLQSIVIYELQRQNTPNYAMLKENIPKMLTDRNHCFQTYYVNLEYLTKAELLHSKITRMIPKSAKTQKAANKTTPKETPLALSKNNKENMCPSLPNTETTAKGNKNPTIRKTSGPPIKKTKKTE